MAQTQTSSITTGIMLLNHGSATSCNYDISGIHTSAHLTLFFTELRCKKEGERLQNNSEKI